MGWETTETKKECGCIDIVRQHDFFNDREYSTIYCIYHEPTKHGDIIPCFEEIEKECGCIIVNYLKSGMENRFKNYVRNIN